MIILNCGINNVPVPVILVFDANSNVIGANLKNILGLESDTFYIKGAKPRISDSSEILPSVFAISPEIIYKLNPSFQTKDNKGKQIEVTEIFISNESELRSVMILGRPWIRKNVLKIDFPNRTLTLLDGTEINY